MKLRRIALEAFRKFRQPVALEDLDGGLNIIVGPNEAGKSTFVAALRAAFLERYATNKPLADLAPWDMPDARPSVTVDFTHDGHAYSLRKQFLHRARCELLIDGGAQRHEGEEAENLLARLLGYEFAGRGLSRPEHAGVPGLLWIQQGEGQTLLAPAGHAGMHVRAALTEVSGELAATDGDRLFERVAAERAALLDARGGKPKGAYKEAEEAWARAREQCETLAAAKRQVDDDVDRLARLRAEYERAQREQPWQAMAERAAQARQRLEGIARERQALEQLQRELAQADETLALLAEQVGRDQHDAEALAQLRNDAQAAQQAMEPARAALERVQAGQGELAAQVAHWRERLACAQAGAERGDLAEQLARLQADAQRQQQALQQAAELAAAVAGHQAQLAESAIDADTVARLREQERLLNELRAQQRAMATRLHHRLLPGKQVELDGVALAGDAQVLITSAARVRIDGVGELEILPGGRDLPALLDELRARGAERDALLGKLGVPDLAGAEARLAASEQARRDLDMARKALRIHAPDGVPALQAEQAATARRRDQLQARLQALPPAAAGDMPPLAEIQQALRAAEQAAEHGARATVAARTELDTQAARAQLLQAQWQAREQDYAGEQRSAQRAQRGLRLVEARALRDSLARRAKEAGAALAAHQPELVEQDLQRYERSAALEREAQHRRHGELLQLQGRLEQAGAQGLGEQLLLAEADLQRLARRRTEYVERAEALDLLWRLLDEHRTAATQRLLEPLARRLQHYLALLFPGAQWRLDETLMPVALRRDGLEDGLDALSFGTREQLGVLARLAYADLLAQAGRPALLVLDDALVHADDARRDLIKRALFDAASRHQVLLFTCHAEAWRDMGVPLRELPSGG
ncbi:GTP-binding protein [Bordetella pertussis]|uniref:GTP-binding protein n=127 Tax=Bordetella pertussis TaxID=520 RepID=Q7VVM1_BORPE|nr:AAA family ATPase [Bordetella pertussis]ETH40827.1 AAA domain protein [Bordetella pertussis H918]ETH42572.1 AAA domain protein [Bordetella pertussis H939]ETH46330.1 AAA domain protein [Bordetella pertussis H921]ETH70026.1 AAA domain protein [Bordetella pertussis STO1-CHLA-0011]ETH83059.1 AAA domain protein [Bordetella pertussis STO1-CHOC-0017]ETH90560.1 AAA domain protein [Bordetella pertussis STO1-CHOC-0019]ETH99927.1 AAA domain protein [Bordetella pertussis STO1-CHOM-0012]KCV23250.1 AA